MLRASLLADAEILPQVRQGSYFFNRIGQSRLSRGATSDPKRTMMTGTNGQKQTFEDTYELGTAHPALRTEPLKPDAWARFHTHCAW